MGRWRGFILVVDLNAASTITITIPIKKERSDMRAKLRTVKPFYLRSLSLLLFHFLILWLLLLVSKVTGFISLGTVLAVRSRVRRGQKAPPYCKMWMYTLKERGTECNILQSILRTALTRGRNTVSESPLIRLPSFLNPWYTHQQMAQSLCKTFTTLSPPSPTRYGDY